MKVSFSGKEFDAPALVNNIVTIGPFSMSYVEESSFIAVDYLGKAPLLEWYFFLNNERVDWRILSDNQRLSVRAMLRKRTSKKTNWEFYCPGEYDDDRYYILEGLEAT